MGNLDTLTGSQASAASGEMIGFSGQFGCWTDNETYTTASNGAPQRRFPWVWMGHREYDPLAARFLTRDPIDYDGGINLYAYCGNNPIMFADPSGLQQTGETPYEAISFLNDRIGDFFKGVGGGLRKLADYAINHPVEGIGFLEAANSQYDPDSPQNWKLVGAQLNAAERVSKKNSSKGDFTLIRFGNELEATQAAASNQLSSRLGHTGDKWVALPGYVNPKNLGKRDNYTHKMTITVSKEALPWLNQNGTIKSNEENRFGIPHNKLIDFNRQFVKKISSELRK